MKREPSHEMRGLFYEMKSYKNLSGRSGVKAYHIGDSYIEVVFQTGETYLYNEIRPGPQHVNKMQKFAEAGKGLSTYISKYVRDNYYAKIA